MRLRYLALVLVLPACPYAKPRFSRPSGAVLYRGDFRPPRDLRKAGGFYPSSSEANDYAFSVYQHTRPPRVKESTQYVSTSKDLGVAACYAVAIPGPIGQLADVVASWVYFIRPTPNFIDVRATLGSYAVDTSHYEFAALGGIRWEQVLGWTKMNTSPYLETQIQSWGPEAARNLQAIMQSEEFIPNADYNPLLDDSTASGAVPQLAGFPEGHLAWERMPWMEFPISGSFTLKTYATKFMDMHKEAIRWRGRFPLFVRLDMSKVALRKVVKASQAAEKAAAKALVEENTQTAAVLAMSAEQESAKARKWLEQLARVFDDHSFLALEGFSQAETYWLDARNAAAKSHWREQMLAMKECRREAGTFANLIPQLASKPEERSTSVKRAQSVMNMVSHIRDQVRYKLIMHIEHISSLKDSLPPDANERALAETDLVWLKFREAQGDAICRELSALRGEKRSLQSTYNEISLLAQEARQAITSFLELVRQIDTTPQELPSAVGETTVVDSRPMVEIALEIVIEVISLVPTPAAPILQILKWGRRAWKALSITHRVYKISKAMETTPFRQVDRLERLSETSSRLEEMLKTRSRPPLANKAKDLQTGKSVDDILHEINSSPSFGEESSGSNHVVDLLQELEAVQIPTENPLLEPEPRPLEDLLQDLNRLEVPNFALEGEARTTDEDAEHAALVPALTARSQPSEPGWMGNTTQQLQTLDREGLLDLILFKLSGFLEEQPLLRKWSALDEIISSFNVASG